MHSTRYARQRPRWVQASHTVSFVCGSRVTGGNIASVVYWQNTLFPKMWAEFVSRLMHCLESFFSGFPRLTTLLFVVSFFLFIRSSDLLAFTVDHRLSIREGQSISGLVEGFIFPDDVTRARLPLDVGCGSSTMNMSAPSNQIRGNIAVRVPHVKRKT